MRKLSILSILLVAGLVVGLAGNAALAADESFDGGNNSELDLTANSVLKMRVKSGDKINLGSFDPQEDTKIFKNGSAYNNSLIQVVSNQDWEVSVSSQEVVDSPNSNYNGNTITDAFLVKLDSSGDSESLSTTGSKGNKEFDVNYGWDAMTDDEIGDMPKGSYTLKVEYTISVNNSTS